MIWLIVAILTIGTLLYVCTPLYSSTAPAIIAEDIDAYRAETQNAGLEESLSFKRQLLTRSKARVLQTDIPRVWLAIVFTGSFILAAFMYFSLGSPQWAMSDVPRVQPQIMPASGADAIAQMSPEDRAAMITAMVDGLAARLRENPEDVEGWVRLLRSRQVLGQDNEEDLVLMRDIYAERPDVIADILTRSQAAPQGAQ